MILKTSAKEELFKDMEPWYYHWFNSLPAELFQPEYIQLAVEILVGLELVS